MKYIIKSLIARSGRVSGLIVEIIIVTIIGWMVIEPVAVKTAIALIPAGYDYDRLIEVKVSQFMDNSEEFDSTISTDGDQVDSNLRRLLEMVRNRKGVEKATFSLYQGIEHEAQATMAIDVDSLYHKDGEDNTTMISVVNFVPGTDYFATYGITAPDGRPFQEPHDLNNSFIVSNLAAKAVTADGQPLGKDLFDNPKRPALISGVVADIPYRKGDGRGSIAYRIPWGMAEEGFGGNVWGIVIRLGDGVNKRQFLESLTADLADYRVGNHYLTHPVALSDSREEAFADQHRELVQKWIIVIFFLVNVFLGIAGTFYVQCRGRIPDAGVMRAFGATRHRIEGSIIGEACLLTFIGWLVGSIIYLIYLKFQGFPMEGDGDWIIRQISPRWYDTPEGRYGVISGIILLLLLATSTLGAWLPARKVGRVNPVDALRNE